MPANGNPNPGPPGGPPGNPNPGQPPGQVPNAQDDLFSIDEDLLLAGNLFANNGSGADNDPHGNLFTVTALNGDAANVGSPITVSTTDPDGILREASLTVLADGTMTLNPLGNFDDLDEGDIAPITFTYTISNGTYTDTATVTVNVNGTNDTPVANPEAVTGGQSFGVITSVLANDTDVDGDDDPSNFSLDSIDDVRVTGIAAGALTTGDVRIGGAHDGTDGILFDTGTDFEELDEGDIATVEVDYTMSDDSGASSSSTFTITVEGSNDAPVANPDEKILFENSALSVDDVLANDTDVDGDDNLSNFELVSIDDVSVSGDGPQELTTGSVTIEPIGKTGERDGISFFPGTDFRQLDDGEMATIEVNYTMSDDSGALSSSTITYTFIGSNSAPIATNDGYTIPENGVLNANLLSDDTDGDGVVDSDPEGHALTVTTINGDAVSDGSVILVDSDLVLPDGSKALAQLTVVDASQGTVTLDPLGNFDDLNFGDSALVNFTYTISDGTLTDTADVQVSIDGLGGLVQTFDDPTSTTMGHFGFSVAIDDDRALIGAPGDGMDGLQSGQSYLFDTTTGQLIQTFDNPMPDLLDWFGSSVAIQANYVVIGAFSEDGDDPLLLDVGQAFLFDATTGQLLQTFENPDPSFGAEFGGSVAVDGNYVIIGAADAGLGVGHAYLFDASTGQLLQTFDDPTPTAEDGFGWSVAIDGNHVLIGAPLDDTNGDDVGQAHLFDASTGQLLQTFDNPTPAVDDGFGWSVAIDGNQVLIGAPLDDTNGDNVGQAHLFDASTGQLLQTFDDPTPTVGDEFGASVALDGDLVLIGAFGDDTNGMGVGQAHLFDANTGQLLETYDDPTPTATNGFGFADLFGESVAIAENSVVIGAPMDDTNAADSGQAYLFDASGLLSV